jgi:hypothetical protein
MLPVKSVSEARPTYLVRSPLGRSHPGAYSAPTSPKIHELRTRYEALHATENGLKSHTGKVI